MVNKKVNAVLAAGMTPIVCVGETLDEREAAVTEEKVTGQLRAALVGVASDATLVVAYEPIWAIGTGRNATAEDAQAVCKAIRATVTTELGPDAGAAVRVQYGGSVKPANIGELMAQADIDGALVGGASLDPEEFARVITYGRN
jgi:triosephosphate isomerase